MGGGAWQSAAVSRGIAVIAVLELETARGACYTA